MKRIITMVMLLVLLLTTLVGCAPAATQPAGATESTGASESTTGAAEERYLRMSVSGDALIDPSMCTYWSCCYSCVNFYDSLTTYSYTGELKPMLAKSWETSEDGMKVTFHLNEGYLFHDGTEVVASDVVYTFNRMVTLGTGLAYIVNCIESAEAPDDYTVVFNMKFPDGAIADRMTRMYVLNEDLLKANTQMDNPSYSYGENGDYGITYMLTNDAGSGAYMVTEAVSGNYVTGVQFPEYHEPWGEKAPTTIKLINTNGESATMRAMLEAKELELSDTWQTTDTYDAWAAAIPGVEVAHYSDFSQVCSYFNCAIAPTDDPYVRKALACLADYSVVAKDLKPHSVLSVGPVPAALPGADASLTKNPYEMNIERAKEYLAQSKYAGQFDQYPIELFDFPGQIGEQIDLLLASAAQEAGLTVTITQASVTVLIDRILKAETTPHMCTVTNVPYYLDAGEFYNSFYAPASQGTSNNLTWLSEEGFQEKIDNALSIVDQEERYAAYAELESYILNDLCPAIYWVDLFESVAYQSEYVYWPAQEYYKEHGEPANSALGYHYIFREFEIDNSKIAG